MGQILPFWVLEPMPRKSAYTCKIAKTRDLPVLANKLHERQSREKSMSKQLSVRTMVCSEYQRLLEESQSALEIWNEHRAEICRSRLIGKEAGDELLRLQAKFARAYTVLRNHAHNCLRCQLVPRIAECGSTSHADALSESGLYV
jgi:hypothetical protein